VTKTTYNQPFVYADPRDIEDSRIRNVTVLSQFTKQTHIDPKLQIFTIKKKRIRSSSRPSAINNNQNKEVVNFQNAMKIEGAKIDILNEDVKEEFEDIHTTPSSVHSAMINTNEKKNAVDYGYSLDKLRPK
jgi:hypothetical protein